MELILLFKVIIKMKWSLKPEQLKQQTCCVVDLDSLKWIFIPLILLVTSHDSITC